MRGLSKKRIKFFLFFCVGIITGVLIGISILSIVVSYRLDSFYQKNTQLQNIIEYKEEQLKKLEKAINNNNFILKDIEVILIYDCDEEDVLDKTIIEKVIKEKYNSLIGKEIKNIDAEMLAEVVDKRILQLEDGEYRLKINKLILSESLKIWVLVEDK
jgi:hypothetical protein